MSTISKKYFRFKAIKGASLTEFVIVTPIAILFVFCIIQAGLLYMAKSTLNNAVFMAARHGANNNAKKSSIEDSLAKGLIPFYINAFAQPTAGSMGEAYLKAKAALINPLNFNKVDIISPSIAMYDTYGINSPAGRYIPNDNLEYRDANPRTSADGQISIRDANILKIKVTYAYDIDKVPLMATLLRRIMCTGFVSKGSVDAWSASNLAGYDIDNCEYYLIKKLPIVAYATVQMQSNAIQVASGASPATPTSPTTPTPVSAPPPTPSSPTTPLQPFPEPPTTIVTPAPVVAIAPTPAEPTPDQPIACEAASAAGNTQVLMGPMTQQQTMVWQQAILQKQLQAAQQIKPQASAVKPGIIVIIPVPGGNNKPILVDPTDPGGPTYTPAPKLPTFPDIKFPPIIGLPITTIINICIPKSPTADSLTAGHNAAAGDRSKPGYGGQCKPDQYDNLQANKNSSCSGARGCNSQDTSEARSAKITKLRQCIAAREAVMNSCFAGGDDIHKNEVNIKKADLAACLAVN